LEDSPELKFVFPREPNALQTAMKGFEVSMIEDTFGIDDIRVNSQNWCQELRDIANEIYGWTWNLRSERRN
jgi:hypothetical protein